MFAIHIFPFPFPKDCDDIFVKFGHVQCVTRYAVSSLEMMLINTPNYNNEMMISFLFLRYVVRAPKLRCTIFPNLKVGWVSGFGGTW